MMGRQEVQEALLYRCRVGPFNYLRSCGRLKERDLHERRSEGLSG